MSDQSIDVKRGRFWPQFLVITVVMAAMFASLLIIANDGMKKVPFAWEKAFVDLLNEVAPEAMPFTVGTDEVSKAWAADLQRLVDELADDMDMDDDIIIKVDYSPDQLINAVAIMGGQVIVFDGLINVAKSENALAFVLAHELAHLKHRHGIRSSGRQLLISGGILIVFGTSGNVSEVVQIGSNLSSLKYSREMETTADEEAVAALARHYGHVNGMDQIFRDLQQLQRQAQVKEMPEILGSHPDFDGRIAHLVDIATSNGFELNGALTPIQTSMSMADDGPTCEKSVILCRIEESVARIRDDQDAFVDPDPEALDAALEDAALEEAGK